MGHNRLEWVTISAAGSLAMFIGRVIEWGPRFTEDSMFRTSASLLSTGLALVFGASMAVATERAIIVFDASGSMWGQIDGKTKLEIARESLGEVLEAVPEDRELGLVAYGHRRKGRCDDIQMVVPVGSGTVPEITSSANKLNPRGKTPLSASVRMAAEALNYKEQRATVILLTDGLETCNTDPCAVGTELGEIGADFTAHVVGFGLSDEQGAQVACLAENTGGKYVQAKDATELVAALTETVITLASKKAAERVAIRPFLDANLKAVVTLADGGERIGDNAVEWTLAKLDKEGKPLDQTTSYGPVLVMYQEPGSYQLAAALGNATAEANIELAEDRLTDVSLNLNAGYISLIGRRNANAHPDRGVLWEVDLPDGRKASRHGATATFLVPAGNRPVRANLGNAVLEAEVNLAAGQAVEREFIISSGRLVPYALFVEGGLQVGDNVRFDVLSGKPDADGQRRRFGTNYGNGKDFDLPPGNYLLRATAGKAVGEIPVTVRGNESIEPKVVLNAGMLVIYAPGGNRLDIMEARRDVSGRRKSVGTSYGESWQVVLPEGNYVVRVHKKDSTQAQGSASIKAGESTTVTVE